MNGDLFDDGHFVLCRVDGDGLIPVTSRRDQRTIAERIVLRDIDSGSPLWRDLAASLFDALVEVTRRGVR